jgi:hypothetical protein
VLRLLTSAAEHLIEELELGVGGRHEKEDTEYYLP